MELFGDTVDTLRWFDVETQRSEDPSGPVTIYPITQFPLTREVRKAIAKRLSIDFMDPLFKHDLVAKIEKLEESGNFPGIEHYVPVAVPSATFADYINDWDLILVEPDQITTTIAKYETLLRSEYEAAAEKGRAVYAPEKLVVPGPDILDVHFQLAHRDERSSHRDERVRRGPRPRLLHRPLHQPPHRVRRRRQSRRARAVLLLRDERRSGKDRAAAEGVRVSSAASPSPAAISPAVSSSTTSASSPTPNGTFSSLRRPRASAAASANRTRSSPTCATSRPATTSFTSITASANSSVCSASPSARPSARSWRSSTPAAASCSCRWRTSTSSSGTPLVRKPSRCSTSSVARTWGRKKAAVKKAMRDMADELLKLYATRQMVHGHAFGKDSPWQFDFEDAFEFDETEDQSQRDRRREERHGIAQTDGSPALRRRRLRQDRGGHARGLQVGDGRQTGGRARADDRPHLPALPHLPAPLRVVSDHRRAADALLLREGTEGDSREGRDGRRSTSWSARTAFFRKTWPGKTSAW